MTTKYIMAEDGTLSECADLLTWARWFEGANRTIVHTVGKMKACDVNAGEITVSTVFLGLDHSFGGPTPILFETMVFGGPRDGESERYATRDEAIAGHWRIVGRMEGEFPSRP